jgi:hypothetical protein
MAQVQQGRIFITGGSGYIGSVITELAISDGYSVVGLSRSEKNDEKLRSLGAVPVSRSFHPLYQTCKAHFNECRPILTRYAETSPRWTLFAARAPMPTLSSSSQPHLSSTKDRTKRSCTLISPLSTPLPTP